MLQQIITEKTNQIIAEKSDQIIWSVAGGLLTSLLGGLFNALQTAVIFLIPCFIVLVLDVIFAYRLGCRVAKKYPGKADGKFKSEYKVRIMWTLIIVFLAIILGAYVDILVIKDGDYAVRFAMCAFIFYEVWSCAENWSSENESKLARALQRVMVNKAERHLNVPLDDIFETNNKGSADGGFPDARASTDTYINTEGK